MDDNPREILSITDSALQQEAYAGSGHPLGIQQPLEGCTCSRRRFRGLVRSSEDRSTVSGRREIELGNEKELWGLGGCENSG